MSANGTQTTVEPNNDPLVGVERALGTMYLQYRAGILAEGLAMLAFDKNRFRRRGVVGALIAAMAGESLWLAHRAQLAPLAADRRAVMTDVAMTAGSLVVIATALEGEARGAAFQHHTFAHHNSLWTSAAVPVSIPKRAEGIAVVGTLWALSCLTGRPGRRSQQAVQLAAFHASGYMLGALFAELARRYARSTAEAELEGRRQAIEAARAETRRELHQRVHARTLQVLEALRASPSTAEPSVRRLAMVEVRRLRRAIRGQDDLAEDATGFEQLVEDCAAAGLRVELVSDLYSHISDSAFEIALDTARLALEQCAGSGAGSAVVRVTYNDGELEASVRTVAQIDPGQVHALRSAVGTRVDRARGSLSIRAERDYGTLVTVRIP